jgi:hypothetical protein
MKIRRRNAILKSRTWKRRKQLKVMDQPRSHLHDNDADYRLDLLKPHNIKRVVLGELHDFA